MGSGTSVLLRLKPRKSPSPRVSSLFVRSPFRAKHYVVVQFMAGWMKCPLPPPPNPPPPPPPPPDPPSPTRPPLPLLPPSHGEHKEGKEESTTLPAGKGLRTAVALSTASHFGNGFSFMCPPRTKSHFQVTLRVGRNLIQKSIQWIKGHSNLFVMGMLQDDRIWRVRIG